MTPAETAADARFLRIGGIGIALRFVDAALARPIPFPTNRFEVPSLATADVDVSLTIAPFQAYEPPAGRLLFDSGAVWRLYEEGDELRFECCVEMFGAEPYEIAFFRRDFTAGRIFLRSVPDMTSMHPLDYPLDEVLVANLLGRGRGIELHGCGVIDHDGRGHLFVGQSGAGKTTTGLIWAKEPGIEIVSDDRVIVREVDGAFRMFGTPWHGEAELSSSATAPLAGVYLLQQAPLTELIPLAAAEASALLFGCAFPPFYEPSALDWTLAILEKIVGRVPVQRLRFTPDASVVECVRKRR